MSDGVETMRIMEVNYLLFFQAALYLARAAGELLNAKQNNEYLWRKNGNELVKELDLSCTMAESVSSEKKVKYSPPACAVL